MIKEFSHISLIYIISFSQIFQINPTSQVDYSKAISKNVFKETHFKGKSINYSQNLEDYPYQYQKQKIFAKRIHKQRNIFSKKRRKKKI